MTKKILIVEDDLIIQMFISKVLSKLNVEIVGETASGDNVLELISKKKPDLILMDIGIKGATDGIETTKLINQHYKIPVVYITGNSDPATLTIAKATSPFGFLFKPFDENKLLSVVSDFIEKQG